MRLYWNFFGRRGDTEPATFTCDRVQGLLSLYVDSVASEPERAGIERHIATCEPCRLQSECLRSIHMVVSSRPVAEPPSDLRRRIAEAIAAERQPTRVRFIPSRGLLAGAAAVLVGITVASVQIGRVLVSQKSTQVKPITVAVLPPVAGLHYKAPSNHVSIKSPIAAPEPYKVASVIPRNNRPQLSNPFKLNVIHHQDLLVGPTNPAVHERPTEVQVAKGVVGGKAAVHPVVPSKAPVLVAIKPPKPHSVVEQPPVHVAYVPREISPVPTALPEVPSSPDVQAPPIEVSTHTGSNPAVRNADLMGSVVGHLAENGVLVPKGDTPNWDLGDTPYRTMHGSVETTSGTVAIVGSSFK